MKYVSLTYSPDYNRQPAMIAVEHITCVEPCWLYLICGHRIQLVGNESDTVRTSLQESQRQFVHLKFHKASPGRIADRPEMMVSLDTISRLNLANLHLKDGTWSDLYDSEFEEIKTLLGIQ